ncbi:AfsR/SARP family transcriptional regulator [Streptomyces sp. LP05-1]|uniref:AfsR/SARP family transcriptional regulator n=1 Tax=Streptomyces pyxinae TaxID=2970734 RepID=A0ABT2CF72_9ACTN|nr:AfsR/SARP family transcriptional regulator [Streptomyces sp. LP05-1]MCS0636050.1 AfsR/SARP family transcriptional regulator [Streptomyces sp. LP05-1]
MGSFEIISDDGRRFAPKAPKLSQMLAVLALARGESVGADTLIREMWGEEPPAGAPKTLQTHVYHARRLLGDAQSNARERQLLVTQAPGYVLDVTDEEVDVRAFERLVRRAQQEADAGRTERASGLAAEALAVWRGPLLGNAPVGDVLTGRIAYVEELRIRALELRVETGITMGRHRELLPELRDLVACFPLHEWFHEQLITVLHRSGRRGEALAAYQHLYRVLGRELGVEPAPAIQRLQAEILGANGGDVSLLRHRREGRPAALLHTRPLAS